MKIDSIHFTSRTSATIVVPAPSAPFVIRDMLAFISEAWGQQHGICGANAKGLIAGDRPGIAIDSIRATVGAECFRVDENGDLTVSLADAKSVTLAVSFHMTAQPPGHTPWVDLKGDFVQAVTR